MPEPETVSRREKTIPIMIAVTALALIGIAIIAAWRLGHALADIHENTGACVTALELLQAPESEASQ